MTRAQFIQARIYYIWDSILKLLKGLALALPIGVVVAVISWAIIRLIEKKKENVVAKKNLIVGFVFYISLLVQMGVFQRPFGSTRVVKWIPFQTPGGDDIIVVYVLANILIFIPFGMFIPKIFDKCQKLWIVVLIGTGTSLMFEVIQYALACGRSEVEDVIANIVGVLVGFLIIKKIDKSTRWKNSWMKKRLDTLKK